MLRLKTRAQFKAVLDGKIVSKTTHFALHRGMLNNQVDLQHGKETAKASPFFGFKEACIGAIVSKRLARRAVTRNAIKRQIYCASKAFSCDLELDAYVVRLRLCFDRTVYTSATSQALKQAVRSEVENLFSNVLSKMNVKSQDA